MKTPKEVWLEHPYLDNLRIFACVAYTHIRQGKFDVHGDKCIFIRYSEGVNGYHLWCHEPRCKKCIIDRDIVFN